jgi:hypothetical protein
VAHKDADAAAPAEETLVLLRAKHIEGEFLLTVIRRKFSGLAGQNRLRLQMEQLQR